MLFQPHGLATGIGSLPHQDPRESVNFVFNHFPDLPYWPQLPQRDPAEGFLLQFIAPLLQTGLIVHQQGKYFLDSDQASWTEKMVEFYVLYMAAMDGKSQALDFFSFKAESAAGFYAFIQHLEQFGTGSARFLKGQISGPITVGLALLDQDRRPVYYHPHGRDLLLNTLALQGMTQARALSRFGLPAMVFVDDPSLAATGQSATITLKKEEIISELNGIYEAIKSAGALTGSHSCAAIDWSILLESNVDVVSFDAYRYFSSLTGYSREIANFLDRGGVLAWGIVPSDHPDIHSMQAAELISLLDRQFDELASRGLDRHQLVNQCLITPSCGTGLLSVAAAQQVHRLTAEVSQQVRGW